MITAITTGAYDLFHIGHLNLLRNAKENCDRLIVGISSSNRIFKYKNKTPIFSDEERIDIVKSCKYVDDIFLNDGDPDDLETYTKWVLQFNATKWFVGTDWAGSDKWEKLENELKKNKCILTFLPYTEGISTTDIILKIKNNKSLSYLL